MGDHGPDAILFLGELADLSSDYAKSNLIMGNSKNNSRHIKKSVALARERTIPTKRPPLVGEVSANFCGYMSSRGRHIILVKMTIIKDILHDILHLSRA
jgi:hypothetical protein